jgi:sec-independent protein translocase protein TatB
VLDINPGELVILLAVALVVVGPERLPHYAQQLAQLIKTVRRMALNARDQVRTELGPEFDDVDWHKLDPRQYDPRRIMRDALSDMDVDDDSPRRAPGKPVRRPGAGTGAAGAAGAAGGRAAGSGSSGSRAAAGDGRSSGGGSSGAGSSGAASSGAGSAPPPGFDPDAT